MDDVVSMSSPRKTNPDSAESLEAMRKSTQYRRVDLRAAANQAEIARFQNCLHTRTNAELLADFLQMPLNRAA